MRQSDHEPRDDMPTEDEMDRIMDYVTALGLHGVMLIGKPCRNCGQLHNFAIASDLDDAEDVPHVLAYYAEATSGREPTVSRPPKRSN